MFSLWQKWKDWRCDHKTTLSRGDAIFCPWCGWESTMLGSAHWPVKARPIVARFYRGEVNHPEIDLVKDMMPDKVIRYE